MIDDREEQGEIIEDHLNGLQVKKELLLDLETEIEKKPLNMTDTKDVDLADATATPHKRNVGR